MTSYSLDAVQLEDWGISDGVLQVPASNGKLAAENMARDISSQLHLFRIYTSSLKRDGGPSARNTG